MSERHYFAAVFIIFGLLLLIITLSWAAPMIIDYQGMLLDDNGFLINGSRLTTFSIYDTAVGGNLLWSEQQTVSFTDSYFSVELGTVTSLPTDLFDSDIRYLEIFIPSVVTKRKALNSKPYAIRANDADTLGGADPFFYAAADHTHTFTEFTGQVSDAQVPDSITIDNAGIADFALKAGDANTVDGKHANGFLDTSANTQTKAGGLIINGDIGIGTPSPSERLDVNGGIKSRSVGFIFPDTTVQTTASKGDAHSLDAADGDPVDVVYVDNEGKVGIGTTTPQSLLNLDSGGNYPVVIRGDANRSSVNTVLLALQGYWDGTRVAGFDLQTGADTTNKDAGRIKFRTAEDASTGLKDRLTIDESGNVGIGTTTPQSLLNLDSGGNLPVVIRGDADRSSAGAVLLALQGCWDGTRVAGFDLQTGSDTVNKDAGSIKFRTAEDAQTGLQDRLIIDEFGNVGIGTTGIITERLEVSGTVKATAFTGDGSGLTNITSAASADEATLALDSDTVDGVHASALEESAEIDDKIAAHSTDPNAHHKKTTSFTELTGMATDEQIPDDITINFAASADNAVSAGDADTVDGKHAHEFGDWHSLDAADRDPVDALYVDNAGSVGIGTTSPSEKLEVAGIVKATGFSGDGSALTNLPADADWTPSGANIFRNTGNVGIGLTNPGSKLEVNGTVSANAFSSTSPLIFEAPIGTERMRIVDTTGNVGIGVTGPTERLEVSGTVKATAFSGDGSALTNLPADADWTQNGSNIYRNTGNVGIGTAGPTEKLEVAGTVKATAFIGDGAGLANIPLDTDWVEDGGNLYRETGNVGIGTRTPAVPLHVRGNSILQGTLSINTNQSGTVLPDQSQESKYSTTLVNNGWQSFTAGLNGILSRIEILSNEGFYWGTITLTVYEGEGTSGDLLYESQYDIGQAPKYGIIAFDIPIEAGFMLYSRSQYTFQIDTGLIWFDLDDPYAGGQSSLGIGLDIWFRTYVHTGYKPGGTVTVTSDGYVGIGTTTPAGLLDVGGGHLVVDPNSGNVGIGTMSLTEKLEVAGTIKADQFIGDGSGLSGIIAAQIPEDITVNYASTAGDANTVDGKHASEFLDTSANSQTKAGGLNISGNVGIGTTSPSEKLEVAGIVKADQFVGDGSGLTNIPSTTDGNWTLSEGNVYRNTGNVGIGTTSPKYLLDIYGTHRLFNINGSSSSCYLTFQENGYDKYTIGHFINLFKIVVGSNLANSHFVMNNSGNVAIGTNSSSYKLHVHGTAYATGAAGALSDLRYKKNIGDLSLNALDVVKDLHPVTFEWIEPQDSGMEGTQLGFIAQEVEKVLPEALLTQDNKEQTKGLKYSTFIPLLTKAIQELEARNDALQAENNSLRHEIEQIKEAVGL